MWALDYPRIRKYEKFLKSEPNMTLFLKGLSGINVWLNYHYDLVKREEIELSRSFMHAKDPKLSCTTTKIATSDNWNGITSKKPGTVLSMQNVGGIPIS